MFNWVIYLFTTGLEEFITNLSRHMGSSVSMGDYFQGPLWISTSVDAQVPYINWSSFSTEAMPICLYTILETTDNTQYNENAM